MLKNTAALYLGGIMAVVAGLLIVTFHNIWEPSWIVVITVFGWLSLLKGLMLLTFPKAFSFWRSMFSKERFMPIWAII